MTLEPASPLLFGDTLVVGASGESSGAVGVNGDQDDDSADSAGAAYVFVRNGASWTQQAYLKASNAEAGDGFGVTVAIDGDTAVVGAPFERSGATGVDGDQSDNGTGLAGAAYVFVRNGTTWTQQAYLKPPVTGFFYTFGNSVAVSGNRIVVGSLHEASSATGVNGDPNDTGAPDAGAAYVFVRNGTTWTQEAYLKASNAEAGDLFGRPVRMSGDTVVIGAFFEDSSATGVNGNQSNEGAQSSGAAYVFVRNGATWTQQAYLKASNTEANDVFGSTVDVEGDTVVVGAYGEASSATGVDGDQGDNSAPDAGAVYVFARSGTTWSQQAYLKASNASEDDQFGFAVVSGNTVVVGALQEASSATGVNGDESDTSAPEAGAAYVFSRSGTIWSPLAYLKASNTEAGGQFWRPALFGDTLVMAAPDEDSAATGVNGDQSDNSAEDAGAAYIFSGLTEGGSTPAGSPTSSGTPLPTSTPMATSTTTATSIRTSTATTTVTFGSTVVTTPSLTPTVAATPANTPTSTVPVPSPTPTRTPTPDPTGTATIMPDPTATRSATPVLLVADINCDSGVSIADLSALVLLLESGEPSPCGTGDVDGDGEVDEEDLDAVIAALFG